MNPLNLLPTNLLQRFKSWVELGVSTDLTESERRHQYVVNVTPMIILLAVLFYLTLFLSIGNMALVRTAVYELPIALSGVIWFRLCQRQHRPASYWAACAVCQLTVFTGIFSGQGTLINTHYYFLVFSLTAPLIIPISHKKRLALVCMECMVCYLALDYFQWPAVAQVQQLSPGIAKNLSMVVTVSCSTLLFITFYISETFSEELETKLRLVATTDALTQMANRRTFQRELARALPQAQRTGIPLCLAILDVDFFKRVNDTYGHDAGDDVLKHVARVVQSSARRGDLVARFGGEEFVVLMHDCATESAALACERIRSALETLPCTTASHHIAVTASVGVAQWQPGMDEKQLLESADRALYSAKESGRNRVIQATALKG